MIFITTGSQKFQFNRLLQEIDRLIDGGVIEDEVYAQIGYSDYKPRKYKYTEFMNRDEFAAKVDESNIIITHGGTGVIIGAVKKGKKVIAVPRLAKYGEHVDDHQIQLLTQFEEANLICACYDIGDIGKYIREINTMEFGTYESSTQKIIDDIEDFLRS